MAVAVTIDIPDGTEQQYEQSSPRSSRTASSPSFLVRLAWPTETGCRVVNVVQSQEQFEAFARERLIPATGQVGDATPS